MQLPVLIQTDTSLQLLKNVSSDILSLDKYWFKYPRHSTLFGWPLLTTFGTWIGSYHASVSNL